MKKVQGTHPEYAKHARRYGKRRANKQTRRLAKQQVRDTK